MGVLPWVTFSAVPLYLMPAGFHACLHSRQGGFRWSCVGKWQFPFFLLQMGHCLNINARLMRQASCPSVLWFALWSVSNASSMASRARIWRFKMSGPSSLFLFAASARAPSCIPSSRSHHLSSLCTSSLPLPSKVSFVVVSIHYYLICLLIYNMSIYPYILISIVPLW